MFAAYFDASGRPQDHAAIVVAGYVATLKQWESFDCDWRLVLSQYNMPYSHMKEYAHSIGPFSEWKGKEGTRANFLRDLIAVIKGNVLFGVASSVRFDVFNQVCKDYELGRKFGCAYALCGRDCVAQISNGLVKRGYKGNPIEFVFDDGDPGKGELMRVMYEDKGFSPLFKSGLPNKKNPGLTPLQAADLPAYELLKVIREGKQGAKRSEFRRSLDSLIDRKNWWGNFTKANLVTMCEAGGIRRI